MSAVTANELDALLARAAAADSGLAPAAAPGGVPVSPQAAIDADRAARSQALAAEIRDLLSMAATIAAPALPRVAALYTPQTCAAVGGAIAPVCVKHGWLQGGLTAGWGEEIAAAIVLVPLSIGTYQAAQADVAAWSAPPPAKAAQEGPHREVPASSAAPAAQAPPQGPGQAPPPPAPRKPAPIVHPTGSPPKGWEAAATKRPEE